MNSESGTVKASRKVEIVKENDFSGINTLEDDDDEDMLRALLLNEMTVKNNLPASRVPNETKSTLTLAKTNVKNRNIQSSKYLKPRELNNNNSNNNRSNKKGNSGNEGV